MEVQSCTAGKVGSTDLHFPDLPVALSELRFQDSHRTSQLAVSKLFETAVPKNRNPTFRTPEVHFSTVGIGTSVLLCGLLHFRLLHFRTFALSPLLSHFRLTDVAGGGAAAQVRAAPRRSLGSVPPADSRR